MSEQSEYAESLAAYKVRMASLIGDLRAEAHKLNAEVMADRKWLDSIQRSADEIISGLDVLAAVHPPEPPDGPAAAISNLIRDLPDDYVDKPT